jgi:hypothetical protein
MNPCVRCPGRGRSRGSVGDEDLIWTSDVVIIKHTTYHPASKLGKKKRVGKCVTTWREIATRICEDAASNMASFDDSICHTEKRKGNSEKWGKIARMRKERTRTERLSVSKVCDVVLERNFIFKRCFSQRVLCYVSQHWCREICLSHLASEVKLNVLMCLLNTSTGRHKHRRSSRSA